VACETCVAIQFFNHLWCSPRGVHNILIKKTRSAISCSDAIAGPHQGQQSHLPVTPSHSHTNYSHQGQQSHLPVTVTPSHSHTYQSHQVTVTPTTHTQVSSHTYQSQSHQGQQSHLPVTPSHSHTNYSHPGQQSHLPVTVTPRSAVTPTSHSHTKVSSHTYQSQSHQGQQSHLPVTVTPSHSHTYQSQSHQVTVTPTNHTKVSSQNGPVRKDTRGERGTHIQHKCTRFQI